MYTFFVLAFELNVCCRILVVKWSHMLKVLHLYHPSLLFHSLFYVVHLQNPRCLVWSGISIRLQTVEHVKQTCLIVNCALDQCRLYMISRICNVSMEIELWLLIGNVFFFLERIALYRLLLSIDIPQTNNSENLPDFPIF